MKTSLIYALASALLTGLLILASPAFAQPVPADSQTYVSLVRTGDLDLRSNGGQRALELRVARAAREVCGTASDADIEGKNEVRKCRDEAIARASSQGRELLAASERGALIAVTATR